MNWIKKFAKASFVLYSGNTLDAFQPLDFFHFFPLWYDLWINRIATAIEVLQLDKKSYHDNKQLLPVPSSIKAIIQKIIPAYKGQMQKNKKESALVTNFLARMLSEAMPEDPFGEGSAPLHTPEEIEQLLKDIALRDGNVQAAKKLGKLITAAGSLVHGLYNDLVTDYGWDSYGSYNKSNYTTTQSLLIRHFPDLRPEALWPEHFLASVKELKIYGIYENVDWHIAYIGCHTTIRSGSPISGLKKYGVEADGKILSEQEIDLLILELASKAEAIYLHIRTKNFEQLKEMVLLQECYQLKALFDAAYMDWRPTREMYKRIRNQPLAQNIVPYGKLMETEAEYTQAFGLNEFEDDVLSS